MRGSAFDFRVSLFSDDILDLVEGPELFLGYGHINRMLHTYDSSYWQCLCHLPSITEEGDKFNGLGIDRRPRNHISTEMPLYDAQLSRMFPRCEALLPFFPVRVLWFDHSLSARAWTLGLTYAV